MYFFTFILISCYPHSFLLEFRHRNDPQASQSYQPIEFLILSLLVLWLLFCNGQYLETESHCIAQAGSLRHSCLCLLSPGVCHQDYWIFISPTKSQANSSPQNSRCVVSQWSKSCVPWQVWWEPISFFFHFKPFLGDNALFWFMSVLQGSTEEKDIP